MTSDPRIGEAGTTTVLVAITVPTPLCSEPEHVVVDMLLGRSDHIVRSVARAVLEWNKVDRSEVLDALRVAWGE